MKKTIFCLALICALFASCGDNEETNDFSIVGTWKALAYNTEGDFWSYAIVNPHYYTFKSDGTYVTDSFFEGKGTYKFSNGILTLDGGFGEKITFSEDGKQMEWGKWRYKRQ